MPSLLLTSRRPTYGSGTKVAYTGTAGTVELPSTVRTVLMWCTTAAWVRVGGDATVNDLPMPAGVIAEIPVNNPDGGPIEVSAVQIDTAGTMFCIGASE